MTNKIISIIGGCGAAGEIVTRLLASNIENEIIIADINFEKAKNLANQLRKNIKPMLVDVFNEVQLRDICQMSNIVVNCAGPTVKILDTVGKIAYQENCDYIEIGGYDYLNDNMLNKISEYSDQSYIISAGWFSGIADYLVYYSNMRADEIFDKKDNLTFFAGDRGWWSDNGLLDTISFAKERATKSMCIFKAGKIKKSIKPTKIFNLPFGINKQRGFLNMTPDLEKFASKHSEYDRIKSFLILFGWKTYFAIMKIAIFLRSEEKCIQVLRQAYNREVETKGKLGISIVEITGLKDDKKMVLWTGVKSKDGYFMTGAGCAATVILMINNKVKKGFGFMSESVNVSQYAEILNQFGIKIEEKILIN
jgi:saccharopine dehydrogenase-like NADP-dependent oxidoreductase